MMGDRMGWVGRESSYRRRSRKSGRRGEVEGQGGISVCNVKWEGGGVCICSGWPLGVG